MHFEEQVADLMPAVIGLFGWAVVTASSTVA